jgi:hypothetical protein
MLKRIFFTLLIVATVGLYVNPATTSSYVVREDGKTYIVDRTGERWDMTQAVSAGFKPEKFRYGLGRDAFEPLDDSYIEDNPTDVHRNPRVVGIKEGSEAHAYSIETLSGHEIANTTIGSKPIAVGF